MRSTSPELARSALDAAADAMIIVDAAGLILYANRQVSALFGYAHDQVVGAAIEQLMPERLRRQHIEHRGSYAHNLRLRAMGVGLELYGRRADGSEFPVEISLSPIREQEQVLVAASIRDVSAAKHAQAEIIAARRAAEQAREAADVAREAADEARQAADRANQAKTRFLATASHDLRQPLQTLALLNGTLQRLISQPEATEALANQDVAIGAMSRLLSALLDMSKLESGAIRPQITDFAVAALFDELRVEFADVAAGKGLELRVEIADLPAGEGPDPRPGPAGVPAARGVQRRPPAADGCIRSDPALVEQILRNLLSNAIKYTPRGSVSLSCRPAPPHHVRLEVRDTGVGIAPEQLPLIADEFYQVGVPANASRDGYGLGLSIVQRLVGLLGLKFEVQSQLGTGSVFALELPYSTRPCAAPAVSRQPRAAAARSGAHRVLLVEDDPAVRDATRLLLHVEGYRVTAVACLQEALEHARGGAAIDLLITDYHLSNAETGTQVIAALRDIAGRALKSVLITGDTSSAVRDLALDPRLRIASKPVKAEELLALLRELLEA